MAYHTTILRQIIEIFPRHEFEALVKDYHVGQKYRSFNRWTQFMVMFIGQLSGRKSLRDLVMNVSAQTSKLYHLAIKPCSRATLARVNEKQPAGLYEAVFHKLLQHCRQFAPKHRFKFNGKLYLLDATVVDLCLSVFPWAKFRTTKGAVKLHVGLDHDDLLAISRLVSAGGVTDEALLIEADASGLLSVVENAQVVPNAALGEGWYSAVVEAASDFTAIAPAALIVDEMGSKST